MAKKHAVRKARSIAKGNGTLLEVIGPEPKQLGARDTVQPRVLFRPHLAGGQCRLDYLMLLAEENGMSGVRDLASVLGLSIGSLLMSDGRALRAFIGGRLSLSSFFLNWDYSLYAVLPQRGATARICPHCRRDESVVSEDLDFPLAIKCQKHNLLLVEYCSSCGKRLTYWQRQRRFCECGMDLANLPATPAPAWVDLFYCIFAPWRLGPRDEDVSGFNEQAELAAATVLSYFMTTARGDLPLERSDRRRRRLRATDYPHVESLVFRWPIYFVLRCHELRRRDPAFPIDRLMAIADSHGLTLLQSAMAIAESQWECWVFGSNGYANTAERRLRAPRPDDGWVRLAEVLPEALPRFVQVGKVCEAQVNRRALNARSRTESKGHASKQAQAQRLAKMSADTIGIKDAAKRLRCDVYQLLALVYGKFIPAKITRLGVTEFRIRPMDVDAFWDCLVAHATKAARQPSVNRQYLVRLCDITVDSERPILSSPWIKTVEAILEGKMCVYIADRAQFGFSGLAVAIQTLERLKRRAGCE